ncbi:hypothetical protein Pan216_43040 [Planctomycetes bacterium Pan216]|uniref:Uncharacterized protein n=1 Tax=Kolteria novifilia TaxID=2527975 RepID=A0A518B8W8_9BACT|nr:hypothetical protein Pan216_43040 [Planctomycetes bacterium Pan216]
MLRQLRFLASLPQDRSFDLLATDDTVTDVAGRACSLSPPLVDRKLLCDR